MEDGELAWSRRPLTAAEVANARVVAIMEAPFESPISARVDMDDENNAATTDGCADERRAAVAGDMEARLAAGLDIQVLGHAAGDVSSPAHVAPRVGQGFAQM